MSIERYRRTIVRHRQEIARLHREKAREAGKAADAEGRAQSAEQSAARTKNLSTTRSKLREAQRYRNTSARHHKNIAGIEDKIAREQRRLSSAEENLGRAEDNADRKQRQQDERRAREHARRMDSIATTLERHEELHTVALAAIEKIQHLPKKITVLFLAANPINQEHLRLDEEVRSITEMIRKAKYRDAVQLESRWAVRPLDILQAINECRPTVIHFSGHGSDQEEIVLQDDAGNAKPITKEAIVQTLAAASGDIQLIFFNTCYSRAQAEAVVEHVPAAIGMEVSIGDDAARVFSAQFYSSIGFGLSVGRAFEQAKAALMLERIPETPELFLTEGLAPTDLVLVDVSDDGESEGE